MPSRYYFSYKELTDENLRDLYADTFKLGRQAIRIFRKEYERNGEKLSVQFRYVRDGNHFNAYAKPLSDKYEIGISMPSIYLLRTLFDNLLLDPALLPAIKRKKKAGDKKHYSVQFLQDIEDPDSAYKKIKITSDPNRLRLSSLLTDFCSAFVVLHEIGHVVLGHADYRTASYGNRLNTLLHDEPGLPKEATTVLHAMEHDADMIATKLLSQYIYNFVQDIPANPAYGPLLENLQPPEHLLESITALVLQGVLSMFLYMGHAASKFNKFQTHPYPVVRIRYIRETLGMLMEENYELDIKLTNKYMSDYSAQFLKAQFTAGLLPFPKHKIMSRPTSVRHTRMLRQHAATHRPLMARVTWVPLSEWY